MRLVYDGKGGKDGERREGGAKMVADKSDFVPVDVAGQSLNLSMLRYVVVDDDFYQDP